jgi:predicted transcriptional regulator
VLNVYGKIIMRGGAPYITIAQMAKAIERKKSTIRRMLYDLGIKPEFYVQGRNGGLEYVVGCYRMNVLERLIKATYRWM